MTDSKKKKVELSSILVELIHGLFRKSDNEPIALQYILQKKYNIPKSTLSRKLKKLEHERVIKSLPNTNPKFYYLVKHRVPKILTIPEKPPTYRLHNLELTFKIIKHSKTPLREQWKLSNWIGSKERFGDVTARFTTKNLILYLQAYGKNKAEALGVAMFKANKIIDEIKLKRPDLVLSPFPSVNRKMHYAIPTPKDIKNIADNIQVSGKGWKIDKSEGEGEIEYVSKDPFELIDKAETFATMPDKIKSLELSFNNIVSIQEKMMSAITNNAQMISKVHESLVKIVSPFSGPTDRGPQDIGPLKQKSLKDYIKEEERIDYIG